MHCSTTARLAAGDQRAIHMLGSNLRLKLCRSRVRVAEVCTGRVETEIVDLAFDDSGVMAKVNESSIEDLHPEDTAHANTNSSTCPGGICLQILEHICGK